MPDASPSDTLHWTKGRSMAVFPGRGRFSGKPQAPRVDVDLPPSLVQPAPLTLRCLACRKTCCATVDRIVIWHGEPDADGKIWDCVGVGLKGLDLKGEGDDENPGRAG